MKILFICLGNICRSCTAQTVMQHLVDEAGLTDQFYIDSAGIINYHEGEMADSRMRRHASRRGYDITHLSRPVTSEDFERFNYIIGMDEQNIKDLQRKCPDAKYLPKIHLMTEWCNAFAGTPTVPDPYYGGDKGFELVLDLLEDACATLLNELKKEY